MDKYWKIGKARDAIEKFVGDVTNAASSSFVPVPERVAVFDCDGTLWCEKPVQIQIAYILQGLSAAAHKDSSLRTQQPFKAAYDNDNAWFGETVTKHYNGDDSDTKTLLGGVAKTFGNMTVEDFEAQAKHYLTTASHPSYDVSYLDMAYLPMVELLDYLTAHGFTNYIVSGGGRDFMRPVTEQLFQIPPERVVGSDFVESFHADKHGAHVMRGEGINTVDDGPTKAVQIWNHIGRRPILAAGNANGDVPMLQFSDSADHPTLRLLVNHDDSKRETDYTAGAEKAMTLAHDQDWTVVSVKDDWKQVFSFQGAADGAGH
jgi:phosphoglycolate phosphatase-like HAD superfamily hydrolase